MKNTELKRVRVGEVMLVSVHGDITEEKVDAIVNAANEHLLHGGGVAGAIVRRGGEVIQEESRRIAPVPQGSAKATGAGKLPCKYVIHAVGPVWKGGKEGEPEVLASAVRSALEVAKGLGCAVVSMPAISAGIFGFPVNEAAATIVSVAADFALKEPGSLREIRFCNIEEATANAFSLQLQALEQGK